MNLLKNIKLLEQVRISQNLCFESFIFAYKSKIEKIHEEQDN